MYIVLAKNYGLGNSNLGHGHPCCIDVREGASGASADAPGVGLEMVLVLKLLQKDVNKRKIQSKR